MEVFNNATALFGGIGCGSLAVDANEHELIQPGVGLVCGDQEPLAMMVCDASKQTTQSTVLHFFWGDGGRFHPQGRRQA